MTAPIDPATSPEQPATDTSASVTEGAPPTASPEAAPEAARRSRRRMTPEILAGEVARLDRILVGVVLVLAFFLGSFVARNSDVWVRLATGHAVLHGTYRFQGDPFAYTLADERPGWVHPGWLADVLFYLLAGVGPGEVPGVGGIILVVLKALAVTATAAILLLIRRPGQSLWIPAACTVLAVAAMSPRLFLQPSFFSFLFLAATLYVLTAPRRVAHDTSALGPGLATLSRWWLIPLFVLWVNLDAWFLLGPVTVGLYLLGQALETRFAGASGEDGPAPGELRQLALILGCGLAACVLNPYHVRVFTKLPAEIWPSVTDSPLLRDVSFRSVADSPLGGDYFTRTGGGLTVAGLSYFCLVVAGIISFAVNSDHLRWWRVVVWLPYCLLSAWLLRGVPFFAVVAGPITALNFQDYAARRFGVAPRLQSPWREWSLAGRALTILAGVVLLLLAWPGWLHARPGEPNSSHRVGWGIEPDPSAVSAAHALCELRAEGLLRHGFNFTPEVPNHCAWFCPDEKAFMDSRLSAFPASVAQEFVSVRNEFKPDLEDGSEASAPEAAPTWPEVFRRYEIDHVIVSAEDTKSRDTLYLLFGDSANWICLYSDGRSTVFALRDPRQSAEERTRLEAHRFDPNRSAFGPNLPDSARCPRQGQDPPQPPGMLARYLSRPAPRPLEVDEAVLYMAYYRVAGRVWPRPAAWSGCLSLMAGATANQALGQSLADVASAWSSPGLRLRVLQSSHDVGPVGAAIMAVRAARQAIQHNPSSAAAYFNLAQAYMRLWADQESAWSRNTRPMLLQLIRQTQIVAALQNALTLEPDWAMAHLTLGDVYLQMNAGSPQSYTHLDLAADELQTGIRLSRASGPLPGETREAFEESMGELDKRLGVINQELQKRREEYELKAKDRPRLVRAQLAYEHGLAGEALERLLEGDIADLGNDEKTFILRLLLGMGRLRDAENLNPVKGLRDHIRVAAAIGDYSRLNDLLEAHIGEIDRASVGQLTNLVRGQVFQTITSPASLRDYNQVVSLRRDRANWLAVWGILVVEAGDTELAARHLSDVRRETLPKAAVTAWLATAAAPTALDRITLTAAATNLDWFGYDLQQIVPHYLGLLEAHGTRPAKAAAHAPGPTGGATPSGTAAATP